MSKVHETGAAPVPLCLSVDRGNLALAWWSVSKRHRFCSQPSPISFVMLETLPNLG